MKHIALALVCTLALVGCKTNDIRANAYKAFAGYVVAEETAAAIVTDKTVPAAVVVKIQAAVKVTAPVAEAMYKDLVRYAALQDELKAIKDVGGTASVIKMEQFNAALAALKDSYALSGDAIAKLIEVVANAKKGR